MRYLLSAVITWVLCVVGTGANEEKVKSTVAVQAQAMRAWANRLSEADYNVTNWDITMMGQPQNYFDHYIQVLSEVFAENGAKVNFIMIGACDGTHDKTIRERFLPNPHWRGVFVEPFPMNFNDLSMFMTEHNVLDRAYLMNAAATFRCNSSTIKMKRPTFEEKNKTLPHWMRREIGAIVPFDKLHRPATGGWVFEYVPCVNGASIIANWSRAIHTSAGASGLRMRLRPHVLKVDVEGHDFEVLMGFLTDRVPSQALPLLISFEAKSIMGKVDALRAQMIKRGYAVSNMANDGFALLKAEFIFSKAAAAPSTIPSPDLEQSEERVGEGEGREEGRGEGGGERDGKRKRRRKGKRSGKKRAD